MLWLRRHGFRWAVMLMSLVLLGCAPKPDLNDLREFTRDAYRNRKPDVEPLPEVEPYESFIYAAETINSPFLESNLREKEPEVGIGIGGGSVFEPSRRRETLEQFPLDSLSMHGTMFQDGLAWVLIRTPDGGTHRITVGNYMGRQNGKIMEIQEDEVLIREVVKGPTGEWEERMATLTLVQ